MNRHDRKKDNRIVVDVARDVYSVVESTVRIIIDLLTFIAGIISYGLNWINKTIAPSVTYYSLIAAGILIGATNGPSWSKVFNGNPVVLILSGFAVNWLPSLGGIIGGASGLLIAPFITPILSSAIIDAPKAMARYIGLSHKSKWVGLYTATMTSCVIGTLAYSLIIPSFMHVPLKAIAVIAMDSSESVTQTITSMLTFVLTFSSPILDSAKTFLILLISESIKIYTGFIGNVGQIGDISNEVFNQMKVRASWVIGGITSQLIRAGYDPTTFGIERLSLIVRGWLATVIGDSPTMVITCLVIVGIIIAGGFISRRLLGRIKRHEIPKSSVEQKILKIKKYNGISISQLLKIVDAWEECTDSANLIQKEWYGNFIGRRDHQSGPDDLDRFNRQIDILVDMGYRDGTRQLDYLVRNIGSSLDKFSNVPTSWGPELIRIIDNQITSNDSNEVTRAHDHLISRVGAIHASNMTEMRIMLSILFNNKE
jgi:hypothetical protein